MNTVFIKIFFSFISIIILEYMFSFVNFEIKVNKNILGALFVGFFSLFSLVWSNFVFWTN